MKKLKLDVIVNSGITNLDTEFEKLFLESTKISIATAIISNSSISIIENCLKQNNCEVQLVVGLYGGFNSKKDLLRLRKLTKKYRDKFLCKISKNPIFHWKYYSFTNKNLITKFVGSSNFTNNGLINAGELNVKLIGSKTTREIRILNNEFEVVWKKESIDILNFPMEKYHSKDVKTFNASGFKLDASITKLLSVPIKGRSNKLELVKNTSCIGISDSYASAESLELIFYKNSDWQKKNYEIIGSFHKIDFDRWKKCSHVLQFEFIGKRKILSFFEIIRPSEVRTVDGNYFVAVKRVKGTGIKQLNSNKTKVFLKSINIKNTSNQKSQYLNNSQTQKVFEYFGVK